MKQLHLTIYFPITIIKQLINSAGFPIDLFWLGDRNVPVSVPQKQNDKPIRSKAGIDINSYENHMFRIKYSNGIFETTTDFVKRAADETVIVEYDNSTGLVVKQITELEKRVDKLKSAMTLCGPSHKDGFSECVTNQLFQDIESIEDRHLTLKKTRSDMANRLRNYTCADPLMRTSTPMATNSMILNGTKITVETFLNEKNAKIFAVPNFVSDEECDILMKHGRPRLQRATVAAQDGTSVVSQSRKAQQASYDFHIARGAVDPLWYVNVNTSFVYNQSLYCERMAAHITYYGLQAFILQDSELHKYEEWISLASRGTRRIHYYPIQSWR